MSKHNRQNGGALAAALDAAAVMAAPAEAFAAPPGTVEEIVMQDEPDPAVLMLTAQVSEQAERIAELEQAYAAALAGTAPDGVNLMEHLVEAVIYRDNPNRRIFDPKNNSTTYTAKLADGTLILRGGYFSLPFTVNAKFSPGSPLYIDVSILGSLTGSKLQAIGDRAKDDFAAYRKWLAADFLGWAEREGIVFNTIRQTPQTAVEAPASLSGLFAGISAPAKK